ncbi:hypothetical protein BGP77_07255 [Saccharospirillum sp. MSK14-1]|nr:hypothetical protein BGP77_07255 [Saccharospirillum sp. MSK14-1]
MCFTAIVGGANADVNETLLLEQALAQFGFSETTLTVDDHELTYYYSARTDRPRNLVLFIQGTDPFPLFFYELTDSGPNFFTAFPDDAAHLSDDYAYVVVAKPALSGIRQWQHFEVPQAYHDANYRQRRISDIRAVITHLKRRRLSEGGDIVVYGHSEGAQVGASLARVDSRITHLGFWSGNVLNNFYEFALFERLAALNGQQSDTQAHQNIMGLLEWYRSVVDDPQSTEVDEWGYTNRRWASYRHAPIDDLLALDIPIYAQFASEDDSTPIETAYLLPVQFITAGKDNLNFQVCLGCDHSYQEVIDGDLRDHWSEIFEDFVDWVEAH